MIYRWVYKIVKSDDEYEIKEGNWDTTLPASDICRWFEALGFTVVYLNRICQVQMVETYARPLVLNGIQKEVKVAYASEATNIPKQNISKCLQGVRQTAGSFYWTYENQLPILKPKTTKIYQYDLKGNLINIYPTKAQAARENNCDSGSITKVCKGQRKTCGGYIWEEKEVEENE